MKSIQLKKVRSGIYESTDHLIVKKREVIDRFTKQPEKAYSVVRTIWDVYRKEELGQQKRVRPVYRGLSLDKCKRDYLAAIS